LVAVCSFWGSIPIIAREVDLPAPAIVFIRVWVAAAGIALVLAAGHFRAPRTAERRPLLSYKPGLAAASGVLLAIHWTAMFAAYQRAPVDTAVFVIFLAPVGVAVLAPRALGERVTMRTGVALCVALIGFALVAGPTMRGAAAAGIAWAGASALTFVALVLVSKPLAAVYGGLRLTLIEMVGAGVVLIPVAAAQSWGSPQAAWAWVVVLGLAHTAVGITLYFSALARVPATHVGILGYLEPVAAVLLAWMLLSDTPRLSTLLGGALIVGAGAFIVLRSDASVPREHGGVPAEGPIRVPG
jgi:drug/metabolite transporter (DMT)-like permease